MADETPAARDPGIGVPAPDRGCSDDHCPFHGTLSVRGQVLVGRVVSTKMDRSIVVEKEHLKYVPKFERFMRRASRYTAHRPPCLPVELGDEVRIAECRPLSKTKSFVLVEKLKPAAKAGGRAGPAGPGQLGGGPR